MAVHEVAGTLSAGSPSIDATRWPDVAAVPNDPARAAAARVLFAHAVARLPLRVTGPQAPRCGGRPGDPEFRLHRPEAFYRRLGASGTIGFGEAYMAGDWSADHLADVLTVFAERVRTLVPAPLQRLRRVALRRQPTAEDNTIAGARRNIHRHYDLSNELFTAFLDDSMTYSAALFAGEPYGSDEDLADAQRRKIDRLLDVAAVGPGTRVLEIGSGWGELAIRAARRGAQVTTLTISTEQADLATARIGAAGLSDRAQVLLQDYRQTTGSFDAIVSVEMLEAVGANHWASYFSTLDRVLAPGGRVGIQAILQADAAIRATGDTHTWIRKYIFPGGQLSSSESIARTLAAHTSLRITDEYAFGRHYAETLRRWRARFEAVADEVAALGFDAVFRRMWSLYLAYSEAGFRSGYLNVAQFTLTRPGERTRPARIG